MPNFMDRLNAGLLGPAQNYGGLLSPQDQQAAQQQAQMAMYANLMGAGGWSDKPTSLGQAIGGASQAGRAAQTEGLQSALQAQLMKSQIARNEKQNLPTSAEEFEYFKSLSPEDQEVFNGLRAKSGPAAIQEFQFFKSLSPEDQAAWTKLQRQPTVPKLTKINGVDHLVDPVTRQTWPLSSLQQEVDAVSAIEGAKAEAGATGKGKGEVTADILKKGNGADAINGIIDIAEPLIDVATGSTAGAAVDSVSKFFGKATDGAQATASLQILQAALMMNQPRMEGPQGVLDVQLYEKMAGQIGDPTIPRDQKKAALKTIRDLQARYKERAGDVSKSAPSGETAAARAKRLGL
jgi:hypothetical protein